MEEDQELKFVCKLCSKKFPCGKSLGGHMRSHVVANSAESDEKLYESHMKKISSSLLGVGGEFGNGQTSYGLRENPRKTWRAADANFPLPAEKICRQCGKGFQSLKALCGHMACHSERDKGSKDDNSWSTSENPKLVVDSQSDTESEDLIRIRTRSSESRKYKKIFVKSPFSLPNNGSSSISEINGEEQEEVAMCLMLLSRDIVNKGGANSVVESSDNNSVILETKSSSIDARVAKTDVFTNIGSKNNMGKKNGDMKLKDRAFDVEVARVENSDSGYFLDECAKAESDASVDGYGKNRAFSFDQYNKFGAGILNRSKSFYRAEVDKELMPKEFESRKKKHIYENSSQAHDVSQKRVKYECFNCRKTFKSYQALGGHRPCHKRTNAFYESRYENDENSLDDSSEFLTREKSSARKNTLAEKKPKAKKNKGRHVCPFCDRVFKNGQALGGHKRSHFIGSREENIYNRSREKKKPDLLDLNLPAPQEDEDDGNQRFLAYH